MAKIRTRIAAIGFATAFWIGANLTAGAQAPVPVRKTPPTPAQPVQAQTPAGAQPASPTSSGGTVTLHCGMAGLSTSLFNTAGLSCSDPITQGKCAYVILLGWHPAVPTPGGRSDPPAQAEHDPRFDTLDFTINLKPSELYAGYYTGISAEPGGIVIYASGDHTVFVVSKFPTVVGLIPQNTELIIKGPTICL